MKIERGMTYNIKHPYLYEFIQSSVLDKNNIIRGVNLDSIGEFWVAFMTILERPRLVGSIAR
jgi:hypothetical protein